MAADERIILSIDVDSSQAEKNVTSLTAEITKLEGENQRLKKSIKDGTGDINENSAKLAVNQRALGDLRKERNQNIDVQKTAAKTNETLNKVLNQEAKTLNELKANNRDLIKIRDNVNTSTKEGQKQFEQLNAKIKQNNDAIKQAEQEGGNFARNVGNYSEALQQSGGAFGQAIQGAKSLQAQFLKLLANPIVAILAAIVAALTLLFKAFKRSEEGGNLLSDTFAKISAAVEAVLGRLTRVVQIIGKIFKGEAKIKDLKGAFKGLGQEIKQAADEAQRMQELERTIIKLRNSVAVAVAEFEKLAMEQAAIADDATRSFQERIQAEEKARKASITARQEQVALAQKELELLDARVAANERTAKFDQELLNQRAQAQVALIQAESELTQTVLENEKRRAEIRQDNFEQQLDFLIDTADNQKTVNERLLQDTRKSLQERQKILADTAKIVNDSFDQQVKLFERENNIQIERNKLLELNNEEAFQYARSLNLSEIETNRLLEVIRERRLATQDLADAERDLADEEEEINQRRKDAINELAALRQEQAIKNAETWEQEFEARQEQIEMEFEQETEGKTLLDEELFLLEQMKQERLDELKEEYAEKEMERLDELTQANIDNLNTILDAAQGFSDDRIGIVGNMVGKLLTLENELKNGRIEEQEATRQAISASTQALTSFVVSLNNQELENYKANKEQEVQKLIDSGMTKEQAEKEFARKLAEKERKQFQLQKTAALLNVGVQTALGIVKTIGTLGLPAAIPFIAVAGALGIAQAAVIASKKPPPVPTFAEGGGLPFGGTLLGGRDHSQGGTKIYADGKLIGEAQKNEGLFITKREATAAILNDYNTRFGGRSMFSGRTSFAQEGGQLGQGLSADDIGDAVRGALSDLTIVTQVEDITTGVSRRQRVLNNSVIS